MMFQEYTEAYGLMAVGLAFLLAQIFARNTTLAVFVRGRIGDTAHNSVRPLSYPRSASFYVSVYLVHLFLRGLISARKLL